MMGTKKEKLRHWVIDSSAPSQRGKLKNASHIKKTNKLTI